MHKITRTTAAVAGSLTIAVAGLAGIAGASSISGPTGPDSWNKVGSFNRTRVTTTNNNNVGVSNGNSQRAYTGDAKVKHNTTGGDATTGNAENTNEFTLDATIDNGSGACGCLPSVNGSESGGDGNIGTTGPDSTNYVDSFNHVTLTTTNNNNVSVSNTNTQKASSGDASVYGNTTGGNATSGDATNTNTAGVTLKISN